MRFRSAVLTSFALISARSLLGQTTPLPFVPHTETPPPAKSVVHPDYFGKYVDTASQLWYSPSERAVGWMDGGKTLVFTHIGMYTMGHSFATRCDESGVFALDLAHGKIRRLHPPDSVPPEIWSPDTVPLDFRLACAGSYFSFLSVDSLMYVAREDAQVEIVNMTTGDKSPVGDLCQGRIDQPQFSPNRRFIATIRGCDVEYGLAVMNVDGTHMHALVPDVTGEDTFSWSSDGRSIVYTHNTPKLYPHGGYPMFVDTNPRIMVVDIKDKHSHFVASGLNPSWSPNGKWIAYLIPDKLEAQVEALHLVRPNGKDDHMIYSIDGNTMSYFDWALYSRYHGPRRPLLWAPDSKSIVFSSGGVLWQIDVKSGVRVQLTSVNGQPAT